MSLPSYLTLPLVCLCTIAAPLARGQSSNASAPASPAATVISEYDEALEHVAEQAMRSVVEIDVTGYGAPEDDNNSNGDSQVLERRESLGSGVIVDPDGYIITNDHVVSGATRIRVVLAPATLELIPYHTTLGHRRRVYEAALIGTNHNVDLAVIKIDEKGLPALALPADFRARLGQTVIAIGSPQGLDHTVTRGIISALGRQPSPDSPMVYVQTDAPINPGNSGGPLIDGDGNLVGINTFIYTSGGGSEGLGFAIPEPIVRYAYAQIKEHGVVRGITIGAHPQTITPDLAAGLGLSQQAGVIFSDVQPGGPADSAGLQVGDIVASVDGVPIDSLPKYTAFLYLHLPSRPLQMRVLRSGKEVALSISPTEAPQTMRSLSDLINPSADLVAPLGVFAINLTQSLVQGMALRSTAGVIVAGVLSGQSATDADLQMGDVIRSMNGKPVPDTAALRRNLESMKPGNPVVLEVERDSTLQYVVFEMD